MKKEYSAPKAEKIEFSYNEEVVACISQTYTRHDAAPGSGGWVCPSCWEYDSWIDETGKCKGHY